MSCLAGAGRVKARIASRLVAEWSGSVSIGEAVTEVTQQQPVERTDVVIDNASPLGYRRSRSFNSSSKPQSLTAKKVDLWTDPKGETALADLVLEAGGVQGHRLGRRVLA